MKNTILTFSLLFIAFAAYSQSGFTVSGLFHQPNWNMTQNGFWASGGARAQFLGKEALRGFPIRLQTGITASYLSGNQRRFADFNQWGTVTRRSSVSNHLTRLGMSIRALSWPGKIRLFVEAEAGGQFMFSTGSGLTGPDFIFNGGDEYIGGDLGYYYGMGGGMQFRLLPFLFAQAGVRFTEGSGSQFVDLNSAITENGNVQYDYVSVGSTGFVEYNLGLYFRLGNHDNNRNGQRRGRQDNKERRRNNKANRRNPTYWDRG